MNLPHTYRPSGLLNDRGDSLEDSPLTATQNTRRHLVAGLTRNESLVHCG